MRPYELYGADSGFMDVKFTVNNHCGGSETAHVKSSAFNYVSGSLGPGGSYSVSVPTTATSMIVFGENGECPGVDGPVCIRSLCSSNRV